MSMELLGTSGNTPGPTAAQAQILYDNLQREAEMAQLRKRRRVKNFVLKILLNRKFLAQRLSLSL